MCVSLFMMLSNLDSKSIEDILPFLSRLARLYTIFFAITAIQVIIGGSHDLMPLVIGISDAVALGLVAASMRLLGNDPTVRNASIGIISLDVYFLYKLYVLASYVTVEDWFGFGFGMLGLFITATSIFIVSSLRGKIIARAEGRQGECDLESGAGEGGTLVNPLLNNEAASAPPMAHAVMVK